MNIQEIVDRVVATLTPDRLRAVVEDLARTLPDGCNSLSVWAIMDALSPAREPWSGVERWQAYLKIRQAIRDAAGQTPGLKYVQVDS